MMSDIKNRKKYLVTINKEVINKLKELSVTTKIPNTNLLDETIDELFKKYSQNNK